MKNEEIKNRIQDGFQSLPPESSDDIFASILSKGYPTELIMEEKPKRTWGYKSIACAVACVCVVLFCFIGIGNLNSGSYILIDVNPSIKILLNSRNEVIRLKGLNQDGDVLVNGLTWNKKEPIEDFMDELLEKMNEDGYVGENSAMLVTMYARDDKYIFLKDTVSGRIESFEQQNELGGIVVAFVQTDERGSLSGQERLAAYLCQNGDCSLEDLRQMSVMELLVKWNGEDNADVKVYGQSKKVRDSLERQLREGDAKTSKTEEKTVEGDEGITTETLRKDEKTTENAETEKKQEKVRTDKDRPASVNKEEKWQEKEEKKAEKQEQKEEKKEQQEQKKEEKKQQQEEKKEEKKQQQEEKKSQKEDKKSTQSEKGTPTDTKVPNENTSQKDNEKSQGKDNKGSEKDKKSPDEKGNGNAGKNK